MVIAAGLFKQLAYKVETSYGVAPGQSGGQTLRRVESTISLAKDTYAANEKRTDFQIADFRHGVRRAQGQIQGELSPKTYSDLLGVLLKRDFAAVTAVSGLSVTIAGSGPYTVTRGSGDFLTSGIKVGDVVRLSGAGLAADNSAKNLLVTDLTATVMTVITLNGSTLTAEGPIASVTATVTGKKTYVPTTGHTDKSIAFEHWYSDITESELYLGCKIAKASLQLPPSGLATVAFDVQGQDMADTVTKRGGVAESSQYFTSPTAITSTSALAAVNGVLRIGGATVATITGLSVDIAANYSGDPVVGSNTVPQLFPGKLAVTGQFTAYFNDTVLRDAFTDESEISLIGAFTTDNTATADFFTVVLPRIKLGSADAADADAGIVRTYSFQALLNTSGGTGVKTEKTTISIQDSAA